MFSYWEIKNWFTDVDYTIVGSGIVGLHAALRLRERFPDSKILIIEHGPLPQGASTKNAGFACFGSLSEINDDLKTHTEEEVLALIQKRWAGLQLLRRMPFVNEVLKPLFKTDVFAKEVDRFDFKGIHEYLIFNPFEGQIDTGNMMQALLKEVAVNNILILNSQTVTSYNEKSDGVDVALGNFSFFSKKLLFATNGFAGELTKGLVKPARAQVLITEPIPNLDIKGTFHIDRGYYYFRNINDRILFGGGRNLDFEGETTTEFGQTEIIQNQLEKVLREVILPNTDFTIAHRWSGIMGLGNHKKPIIEQLSQHTYCGVRLGGMGVAIGSMVGAELGDLV